MNLCFPETHGPSGLISIEYYVPLKLLDPTVDNQNLAVRLYTQWDYD